MHITKVLCVALLHVTCATTADATSLTIAVRGSDGAPAHNVVVMLRPMEGNTSKAPPPAVAIVRQRNLRFSPAVVAVRAGGTVRFVNEDEFDHHVVSLPGGTPGSPRAANPFTRLMPPSRDGRPSTSDVVFDSPGTVIVGCHLHGSMRAHVFVGETHWLAVTDSTGRATLDEVPSGAAELTLWHPHELVDQQRTQVRIDGDDAQIELRLNFEPKPGRAAAK